jgi:hypothetical protein
MKACSLLGSGHINTGASSQDQNTTVPGLAGHLEQSREPAARRRRRDVVLNEYARIRLGDYKQQTFS